MPPETLQVVALGLIQGATELLPVSSSAHIAAIPQLLRWSVAEWPDERRKELEVALHAGALLALAPSLWRVRPDVLTLALSLAPPVIAGYALEGPIEERLGGPAGLATGLVVGALALGVADRRVVRAGSDPVPAACRGRRKRPGLTPWARGGAPTYSRGARLSPGTPMRVGLALGAAQAAALVPGVSRSGATLAAARALGYSRPAASRLSFGVAGPVLAGATALKAWRGREGADLRLVATGAAAAFAGTAAALKLVGLERRRPLWPFAAERVVLAGAILGLRYRRAR
jgi:undecaprenyl-diphosphatase